MYEVHDTMHIFQVKISNMKTHMQSIHYTCLKKYSIKIKNVVALDVLNGETFQ